MIIYNIGIWIPSILKNQRYLDLSIFQFITKWTNERFHKNPFNTQVDSQNLSQYIDNIYVLFEWFYFWNVQIWTI